MAFCWVAEGISKPYANRLYVVIHACNPSTLEGEAGGPPTLVNLEESALGDGNFMKRKLQVQFNPNQIATPLFEEIEKQSRYPYKNTKDPSQPMQS